MKKQHVLYPDRVAIAKLADIVKFEEDSGTVTSPVIHSLDTFFSNGFSKIPLGTEGIQVQHSATAIDIQKITPAGIELVDVYQQEKGAQITITQNAWTFALEAMLEGRNYDAVSDDLEASKSNSSYTYDSGDFVAPSPDVSNAKGVDIEDTIFREPLSLLFTCPVRGGKMYFLAPKVKARPDNRDVSLLLQNITPALVLSALALEDDEVAPFKNIYENVTQYGLMFKFFVPTQSV